jgi:hypothetical protein
MLAWDLFCCPSPAIKPVCLSSLSATVFCFHQGIAWGVLMFPGKHSWGSACLESLDQCISPLAYVFHKNLMFVLSAISCTCLIWFTVPNPSIPSHSCWSAWMSMAVPIVFVDIVSPPLCWHEIELCERYCLSCCLPRPLGQRLPWVGIALVADGNHWLLHLWEQLLWVCCICNSFVRSVSTFPMGGNCPCVRRCAYKWSCQLVHLYCAKVLLNICTLGTWFYPLTVVIRHIQGLFVVTA